MRAVIIIAILACVAYANSLHAPFVYDDLTSIQHNRAVRFFSFNAKEFLETRSLLYPTYALNEWLGGENVFGYHVINLLLHLINGLLVFAIAKRIFQSLELSDASMYALLASAFFVVHPIQTEAVTYITERSELLSKLVYLCGLLFFMALPEKKIGFFASMPVFFCLVLGLGFKETAITLPASIVLYDYIFISKAKIRNMLPRWRFYAGLSLWLGAGVYAFWNALWRPLLEVGNPGTLRRWYFFITELRVIARYLRLIVFPSGQNLDYDFPPALSIREPGVLLSILLIIGLLVLAWLWRRKKPVYAFSIFWFFITIAPLSSIVPIPDVIAEHRLYLPLAGVCLSFPMLLRSLTQKHVLRVGTAVLAVLLVATVARNYVWADESRLFTDVVAKSPHKLRAYENLIFAHMKQGQEEQAISVANAAIEHVSTADGVSLMDTLGNLYLRLGRNAEAVEYFKKSNEESVRMRASNTFVATSFNNLGAAYLALANSLDARSVGPRSQALRNAREAFERSLENESSNAALDSLVEISRQLGESADLEQQLHKNLIANPNDFRSLYMMAGLLSLENRYAESLDYFRRAEEQNKQSEVLHFNFAFALSKTGQTDPAIEEYMQALRIDPIFHEAHYNLAMLYVQKADYASALQHLNQIVSLEAANVRANMKLAEIYAYEGKLPLARQHLQQVLKANPQDREALNLFARIGG
jgi:tetratricopeptide (TPR) repeat protein